jgi:hypothetical protein
MEEEFTGSIEVKELRNQKPPEWMIVAEFYQTWKGNDSYQPTKKELEQARQIVEQHGFKKAKDLMSRVVKRLEKQWPDAKTFGAIAKYLPDVLNDYDRDQSRIEREQQEQLRRKQEREERRRREAEQAQFCLASGFQWNFFGLFCERIPRPTRTALFTEQRKASLGCRGRQ